MNDHWIVNYGSLLLRGVGTTLSILLISALLGFALALLVALARMSRNLLLAKLSLAFTSVFRGTPLLVQIYVFYYGLGSLFAQYPLIRGSALWPYLRDGYWYIVLALICSVGAYVGEVVRGGLRAVPRGELEAASAFGMNRRLVLYRVWLPRAIRLLLPTLAGESVMLLKSTALASTIAVVDLLGAANVVRAQTFQVYQPLLLVAAIYVCLTFIIEGLFGLLERSTPLRRESAAPGSRAAWLFWRRKARASG
ncbi:ABC transporter permease [Pseudomonas panipatensis]|uniref:ABC transporter permease n=1 Tax=Pseudomonas panipatensis TaxID=428992 RepID=UPI0035AF0308